MGSRRVPRNIALDDQIAALLRDADDPLTAAEISRLAGAVVGCACQTDPKLAARHGTGPRTTYYGDCGGTGWRRPSDVEVRPRLDQMVRRREVAKVTAAGRACYWMTRIEDVIAGRVADPIDEETTLWLVDQFRSGS